MLKLSRRGKKGTWQISGSLAGQRVRESTGTRSEGHAQAILARRQKEILDRYTWGEERTATFSEAAVLYLTKGGEQRFMTPLLDRFGLVRLADITEAMVAAFAAERYPNAGPQGINRQVYTPLIAVFRAGAKAKLCALPHFTRPKQPKRKAVVWAKDDYIAKFLPACSVRLKAATLLITFSGARASEACRLESQDVDWEGGTAILRETKNGTPRTVKLPLMVLDAMLPLRGSEGALFGFKTRHSLNQAIKRAAKRAGLPYLSSHKIGRHAFAARLLKQGNSGPAVQTGGGWKSARLFHETYGHLEHSHVDQIIAESDTDLARATGARSNKVVSIKLLRKRRATMSR